MTAALLANVGLTVSHAGHHKHSYYVIRHSDRLLGFTDAEIERIALVARYHRKSAPKASHPEYARLDPEEQRIVRILRIAIGLDRTHARAVEQVAARLDPDGLVVTVTPRDGADVELELYTASERSGLLADVLGRPVVVTLDRPAVAP